MEGDAVLHAVERGVLSRHLDRYLVNVAADDLVSAQQRRCDGQDAASAADIQHRILRGDVFFQQLHAQAGGVVGAGAKGHAGI